MHELAVCQALLSQVEALAHDCRASRVQRIRLQIGPLSGVEPDLLMQAFALARAGSCAGDAELDIERLPVRVRCRACGAESQTSPNRLLCHACGSCDTRLLGGDELLLRAVEFPIEDPAGAGRCH
jgi:hydrogenase nickel incorporation protein HypA/HybF